MLNFTVAPMHSCDAVLEIAVQQEPYYFSILTLWKRNSLL